MLLGCGRLIIDEKNQEMKDKLKVKESFEIQRKVLKKHSNWLNSKSIEKFDFEDELSNSVSTNKSKTSRKNNKKNLNNNIRNNNHNHTISNDMNSIISNSSEYSTFSSINNVNGDKDTINELLLAESSQGKSLTDKQLLDLYRRLNKNHSSR